MLPFHYTPFSIFQLISFKYEFKFAHKFYFNQSFFWLLQKKNRPKTVARNEIIIFNAYNYYIQNIYNIHSNTKRACVFYIFIFLYVTYANTYNCFMLDFCYDFYANLCKELWCEWIMNVSLRNEDGHSDMYHEYVWNSFHILLQKYKNMKWTYSRIKNFVKYY